MQEKDKNSCSVENNELSCKVCSEGEFNLRNNILQLGIGTLIFAAAWALKVPFWAELSLFLLSYFIIARDIVWKALKNTVRGRVFDENFLLTVATVGAFAIKEFPEAVAVMLFFKIGEIFQDIALYRSRKSISSLMDIKPDYANLKTDGETKKVSPYQVKVEDLIVVKPGEKVPLDGTVIEGSSTVDTSALTGESIPKEFKKDDEILSGMINKTGVLTIRVSKEFTKSTVSKILDLVEHASAKKAPTEKFITRFARYYTPTVVFGAVLLAVVPVLMYKIPTFSFLFSHQETFSEWIYRALVFLVISCPCALVISIPLGFFGGIGASAKRGILVKGSNYLEGLNHLHTVVWDKTGTLTEGVFKVTKVVPSNNFSEEVILRLAAEAESHSNHPIARSIFEAYGREIDERALESYEELSGYGVKAQVEGHEVLVGNDKLLHRENIEHDGCKVEGTVVHVVVDRKYTGYIIISDEAKEDAKDAISNLRNIGVRKQVMLTGDSREVAEKISENLVLDEYYAELLPHEKVKKVEELLKRKCHEKCKLAFVGDGINDAPVLARSDIGVAMGALGSDAAIEAADVVLMTDEPSKLYEATRVAGKTQRIVWENIFLALGVKGFFLLLGALGMATMWEAVFADVGVALLAILNATRVISTRW
jgi:Cd2+/Zn2+-exporting ATPase